MASHVIPDAFNSADEAWHDQWSPMEWSAWEAEQRRIKYLGPRNPGEQRPEASWTNPRGALGLQRSFASMQLEDSRE